MAKLTTRQELIDYALRRNGFPVVEVNISPEQIDDRVDDALQFFKEYLFSGTERTYVAHILTEKDFENGYIEVPTDITTVIQVLALSSSDVTSFHYAGNTFEYDWGQISPRIFSQFSASYYTKIKSHLETVNRFGNQREVEMEFNTHTHRVQIMRPLTDYQVGDYVVMEAYRTVDPERFTDVYNDIYLKEYVYLLIKKQWGENLSKFDNVQLMGGVTFNGAEKYQQATQELTEYRERLLQEAAEPPGFFMM